MGMVVTALAAIRRIVGLLSACRISACRNRLTAAPTLSRITYGRLYRASGLPHVYVCAYALILAPVVLLVSRPAYAGTPAPNFYSSQASAMAGCKHQASVNRSPVINNCVYTVYTDGSGKSYPSYLFSTTLNDLLLYYYWNGPIAPDNPCSSNAPSTSGGYSGKVMSAMTWCKAGVPTGKGDGSTVSCTMAFVPSGAPIMNQWGSWHTAGTLKASGDLCDGSGGSGSNNWKNADGTPAAPPVPPSPDTTPPVSPAPQTCGGGSCYDANSDQYCATSGGAQICVSGGNARSPAGSCASSGDSTVCAGSPNAPRPPTSNVPDAAGALRNTDSYTQADSKTGANQSVAVNTYTNQGGQPTTNGQKPGDSGPPTDGSGKSDCKPGELCNDRYIGAPCDVDPLVAGDPLLGAIAVDMHHVRCQSDKQGIKASDFDGADRSKGDDHSPDEVFSDGSSGGSGNGLSGLDSTGFLGGHGVCPGFAPIEYLGMNILPSDGICRTGEMLSAFILAAAYAVAALIMSRMKAGG